jgi:hypothetical protein
MNAKCFGFGDRNILRCQCKEIFETTTNMLFDSSGALPHDEIVVQTRLGNAIDNVQPWQYAAFEWNQLDVDREKFESLGASRVNGVCPIYNCHGLTFGSRRTQVDWSPATIAMIIRDDGFEEIADRDVKVGNVVIYYGEDGKPEHSGIVVGKHGEFNVPLIWSKWGKGHEWVHPLGACGWGGMTIRFYRIQEWKSQTALSQNLSRLRRSSR